MENEKIRLSYSRLSDFDSNGAKALIAKSGGETNATKKGSLVNDILFENEDFIKTYFIKQYDDPTASSLKLANIIVDNYASIPSDEEIIQIARFNELWSRSKDDKILQLISTPEFREYLEVRFNAIDKVLINPSMLSEAEELVGILKTHEHSRHFFRPNNYRLITEYAFEIDYDDDVILRGFVDMIVIDDIKRTFRIVDLKTGIKKFKDFGSSVLEWRYYLQEATYMLAADKIKQELGVEDYTTLPFQFLYIGVKELIPVVYEVTEDWHIGGLNGFTTTTGYTYKGLHQLIKEAKYHFKHKLFELDYETNINKGLLTLRSIHANK